jgi:uncharacterized protein (DUF433 family)
MARQEGRGQRRVEQAGGRITRHPGIMLGQPVIRGTRITVAFVLRCLATMSVEEFIDQYPFVTREDVAAALEYAAEALEGEGWV